MYETIFSKKFLRDAGERAARTFVQVFGATALAAGFGVVDADEGAIFTAAALSGLAAVLSVLTALVALPVGDKGSASFLTDKE